LANNLISKAFQPSQHINS